VERRHALEYFIPAVAEDLAVFRIDVEKPAVLDDRHADQGVLDETLKLRLGTSPVGRQLHRVHSGNLARFTRPHLALMSGRGLVTRVWKRPLSITTRARQAATTRHNALRSG